MSLHPALFQATLAALMALASLTACRQQTPPASSGEAAAPVTPSSDVKGASDQADAAPAIGALTAGQASHGATGRATQPTGGDGSPAASAPGTPAAAGSSPPR